MYTALFSESEATQVNKTRRMGESSDFQKLKMAIHKLLKLDVIHSLRNQQENKVLHTCSSHLSDVFTCS